MIDHTSHQQIGILMFFVDICSGMSAQKSGRLQMEQHPFFFTAGDWTGETETKSSCTADCGNSLVLGIQIDHGTS